MRDAGLLLDESAATTDEEAFALMEGLNVTPAAA